MKFKSKSAGFAVLLAVLFNALLVWSGPASALAVIIKGEAPTLRQDKSPLPANAIIGYTIKRGAVEIGTPAGSVLNFTYQIPAGDCIKVGEVFSVATRTSDPPPSKAISDYASFTVVQGSCAISPPMAPTNLQIIISDTAPAGTASIVVSWDPVVSRVDGSVVQIERYALLLDNKALVTVKGLSSVRTIAAGKCLDTTRRYSVQAIASDGARSKVSVPASVPRIVCGSLQGSPCSAT